MLIHTPDKKKSIQPSQTVTTISSQFIYASSIEAQNLCSNKRKQKKQLLFQTRRRIMFKLALYTKVDSFRMTIPNKKFLSATPSNAPICMNVASS